MGRTSSAEEIAIATAVVGMERRKQQRFACGGPAEVVDLDSGCHYQGQMKDLSLTGCYIQTGNMVDLHMQDNVALCLCVDGDSLNTPARVIAVRPEPGAAFEFLPIDPEMRAALLTLLQRLTAELPARDTENASR
jgi:hypothetical protein